MIKTFMNPPIDATLTYQEWWRRAEIPAANGQGNARSVAAIQSIVAGRGEARGVRLLSAAGHRPHLRGAGGRDRQGARDARSASAWATA